MLVSIVPSGTYAILVIDPGKTTGLFAGYVDLDVTVKETLETVRMKKSAELRGDNWLDSAHKINDVMNRFVYTANVEQRLRVGHIHIVFEDFVQRYETSILDSIWMMAGAVTCYTLPEFNNGAKPIVQPTYQQPSEAKSFATNERLKLWNLWEVGSEHRRDAARHFAKRIDLLLSGK